MSIELLKSISKQKAHKTCYKQGSILHYLGTNHSPQPRYCLSLRNKYHAGYVFTKMDCLFKKYVQLMSNLYYDKLECIKTSLGEQGHTVISFIAAYIPRKST